MELVLASHSNLAKGMFDTVSLIMGKQKVLHYITAYMKDNVNFSDQLKETVKNLPDSQIIFASDVLGGSVNNELVKFTAKQPNYFLVSGMNLPFVLELINYINSNHSVTNSDIQRELNMLIEVGRQGLQVVQLEENIEEDSF
jgi:fructoselysine/glucoselysine PTS system EIIA component